MAAIGEWVSGQQAEEAATERRQSPRHTLHLPVTVRGTDATGQVFSELAVVLNLSCGGALLAIRRPLPHAMQIALQPIREPQSIAGAHAAAAGWRVVRVRFPQPLSEQRVAFLATGGVEPAPPVRSWRNLLSGAWNAAFSRAA